jgi:hypothetical protein
MNKENMNYEILEEKALIQIGKMGKGNIIHLLLVTMMA